MLRYILAIVFVSLLSCTSQYKNSLLNPSNLESQFIVINPCADTLVRTAKGALLNIQKGTFDKQVRLELKEAYSTEDIIRAGLVTQSDGKPLSSGGMIYINNDQKLEPKNPIGVSIPTDFIDENMQLYKGEEEEGGINWTDPTSLSKNPAVDSFAYGKSLFQSNCYSCHRLFGDGPTAPSLAGVQYRGQWGNKDLLYKFTRNPAAYKDCYVDGLKKQYGYVMNGFPNLNDKALDALYAYVENETRKAGIPIPENNYLECLDSCRIYDSLVHLKYDKTVNRTALIDDNNETRVTYTELSQGQGGGGSRQQRSVNEDEKVQPDDFNAIYYKFDIKSNGWYNVDMILDEKNVSETSLKVDVVDSAGNGINVFLVVPSVKLFVPGGKLKGEEDQYGFYHTDGRIPLPIGAKAYIFAISEADDRVLFASMEFTVAASQTYSLQLKPMSKEEFNNSVKRWKFEDVTFNVRDSRIREQVKEADKDIRKLDTLIRSLKPKNCNCNCDGEGSQSDTTLNYETY
jgi:mono/diheme cytochrome c family protein